MNKLRLLNIEVTPRFVLDDGDNLTTLRAEHVGDHANTGKEVVVKMTIAPADWGDVQSLVEDAVAELRKSVEATQAADAPA